MRAPSALLNTACALVLLAACGPTSQPEEAASLVSKHLEACGGVTRLRAIHSIRESGTMALTGPDGWSGSFVLEEKRPNKSRIERIVDGGKSVRAFDGTTGWVLQAGERQARAVDEAEVREMAENDFDSDLLDYDTREIGVALVGAEDLERGRAYKLKVSKHGSVHYSYLDQKSFLEVRRDYVHADGATVQQLFRRHEVVDGVVRPMEYETGQEGDPRRLVVTVQRVEVNPLIPDERYRMPVNP